MSFADRVQYLLGCLDSKIAFVKGFLDLQQAVLVKFASSGHGGEGTLKIGAPFSALFWNLEKIPMIMRITFLELYSRSEQNYFGCIKRVQQEYSTILFVQQSLILKIGS